MSNRRNHKNFPFGLRWALVAASLIIWSSTFAQTVVLHLRNGDRITGTLISESTNALTIATVYSDKITVPIQQIERRVNAAVGVGLNQTISATNASPVAAATNPPPASPTQPGIVQSPPSSPPAKAPAPVSAAAPSTPASPKPASTNKVASAKPSGSGAADSSKMSQTNAFQKFLFDWKGELRAGLNLAFSTKDRQLYTGGFKATHSHKALRNILEYNLSYGRTEGVLSDNRMDGSWKVEYDISKRFLAYNAAGAGYDEIRKIELQYDVGPGFGYKWLTRTNFVLKSELGGNYQEQFFEDDIKKSRYSLRLAEDFWWQVSGKVRWDEKLEFFPQIDNLSEYRVRVESNLSYLLRNNLTLNLTVIDLYDTSAPGEVSHNDLQIRSSIGIKF